MPLTTKSVGLKLYNYTAAKIKNNAPKMKKR